MFSASPTAHRIPSRKIDNKGAIRTHFAPRFEHGSHSHTIFHRDARLRRQRRLKLLRKTQLASKARFWVFSVCSSFFFFFFLFVYYFLEFFGFATLSRQSVGCTSTSSQEREKQHFDWYSLIYESCNLTLLTLSEICQSAGCAILKCSSLEPSQEG